MISGRSKSKTRIEAGTSSKEHVATDSRPDTDNRPGPFLLLGEWMLPVAGAAGAVDEVQAVEVATGGSFQGGGSLKGVRDGWALCGGACGVASA